MNLSIKASTIIIFWISLCCYQIGYAQLTVKSEAASDHLRNKKSNIPAESITIDNAVAISLKNRHEVKAVEHQLEKSQAEFKATLAGWYPKLDLITRVSRNEAIDDFEPIIFNLDEFGFDEFLYPKKNIPDYGAEAGFRLTQLLYTGGRTTSRINAAKGNYLAAEIRKTIETRQVALTTILTCWDLKLSQMILSNTRAAENQLGDLCQKINNRYNKGTVSKLAWQRAEAELLSVKLAVERALRENQSASDKLVIKLGLDRNSLTDVTIIDDESIIPEISNLPIEKIVVTALKTRPEVLKLEKQVQSQIHEVEWEKSRYFPTIAMEGEYAWIGYDEQDPGSAISDLKDDYWSVSINCRLNLFQGGQTYYSVTASKEQLADLEVKLEGLKQTITGDIHQLYNLYQNQIQVVETATYRYELEKENLDMVLDEFRLGVATIDKVADYHEHLLDAIRENIAAMVELQKNAARFRWATGMKLP